jgi:hypothetical protein
LKHISLVVLAAIVLSACGVAPAPTATRTAMSALQARATDHGPILSKPSAGLPKRAEPLPQPEPPRQGITKKDAATIAGSAYAQAFAAKTPAEAIATAKLALEKIEAGLPTNSSLHAVVRYARTAIAETEVSDPENARRIALWPLHYLKKGVQGVKDPLFFEMTAIMMESMLNWQDGLALGLVTLDYLGDHPDGYVKTMAAKAYAKFRSPKVDLEASYKLTLQTMKDIQETLEALK